MTVGVAGAWAANRRAAPLRESPRVTPARQHAASHARLAHHRPLHEPAFLESLCLFAYPIPFWLSGCAVGSKPRTEALFARGGEAMESISRISSLLETGRAHSTCCSSLSILSGFTHFSNSLKNARGRTRLKHASFEFRSLVPVYSSRPYPRSRKQCQQCPPNNDKRAAFWAAQKALGQ